MTFDLHLSVDLGDPTPPYEQLRRQLAGHIRSARLPGGARLPPVRQLAADLGLAAGTVARVYRELEDEGLITTGRAKGTHVTRDAARSALPDPVRSAAARLAEAAKENGMDLQASIAALEANW